MSKCILDASALLALVNTEPGAGYVEELLPLSVMSTVNVAEVVAELDKKLNITADESSKIIHSAINQIIPLDF
jgi:PIN domain nuclease of toxin-antitoxin system